MNNPTYQTEDLLTDESFILYCYDDDAESVKKWENILKEQPALAGKIHDARKLCLLLGLRVSRSEKANALDRLKIAIEEPYQPLDTAGTGLITLLKLYIPRWSAIAAALILITGAIWFYSYQQTADSSGVHGVYEEKNYTAFASTDFDHRKTVSLPDGTEVLLNGASSIKLAKDYNEHNRHLMLNGEAYFKVRKDHSKPFVVFTGKTATTALGTEFKVQSYSDHKETNVLLASGKVKVEDLTSSHLAADVFLLPGESASLSPGQKSFVKKDFDVKELQNWIDRELTFTGADLPEITEKLKEMYGTTIIPVNGTKSKISFTGEFNGKKLSEVLDAIGFTNHFTYRQEGNTVKLIF